jgi:hypothetical protein
LQCCDYECGSVLPCGHVCKRLCHSSSSCFSPNFTGNPCGVTLQNSCQCGTLTESHVCDGKVPMAPLLCTSCCIQPTHASGDDACPTASTGLSLQSLSTDIWGLDLILAARRSVPFIVRLESVLHERIASIPSKMRWKPPGTLKSSPQPLWPMPSEQRYIVHRVCEKYGLACSSTPGAASSRVPHVTLTESCLEPSILLSQAVSLYCR